MTNIEVQLKVNKRLISGFDVSTLSFNLYTLANKVVLEFNNKKAEDLLKVKEQLKKLNKAEIYIKNVSEDTDPSLKMSGYISAVESIYKKGSPVLRITVLSDAGKYVKNAVGEGKTFLKQKVSNIVKALCPDVKVTVITDKVLSKFIVYGSENINSVIAKLHRKSGLLIYSGVDGIEIASKSEFKNNSGYVITGENILDVRVFEKDAEEIILSGQKVFDDDVSIKDAVCSKLISSGLKKRFVYGDDVSLDALNAAKNKGLEVSAVIPSWFDLNNNFISLNTWMGVKDAWLSLNSNMLLCAVDFRLDKDGYQAFLELEKND